MPHLFTRASCAALILVALAPASAQFADMPGRWGYAMPLPFASTEIAGAVVDVAVPEPLPADSRLWATPNLFVSPHVSVDDPVSYTPDSLDLFFLNLGHFLRGEEMPNRVDAARGY